MRSPAAGRPGRLKRENGIQFLVETRRIESPQVPVQAEIALAKGTFQQILQHTEPRITAVYPHAGQRSVSLVIDAASGEELSEVLFKLPLFPVLQITIHPLTTVEQVMRAINEAEAMAAQMGSPPGAS
jgi:hypothetical protein